MGYWKNILPQKVWKPLNEIRRNYFPSPYASYSGEGEDLILEKIFHQKKTGFYIDIGCYHPKINSNTYKFYKRGWNGINIDANPQSIETFNKHRKRDKNILAGVGEVKSELKYYMFDESAINTFSESLYLKRKELQWITYLGSKIVEVEPLCDILDRLEITREIDFMDIDVEGHDLHVLKSNDWSKYIPNVILVEDQSSTNKSFEELETYRYLIPKDYQLFAKTFSTLIFIQNEYLRSIT